jgi:hypothetical protein
LRKFIFIYDDKANDKSWSGPFHDKIRKLEARGSGTFKAPVLLQVGNDYYNIDSNTDYLIAWRYNKPVRFWVVKATKAKTEETMTEEELEKAVIEEISGICIKDGQIYAS